MCVAIEEMRKESELRGELKGEIRGAIKATIEMCREFGKTKSEAIEKVIQKFGISEDDADRYAEQFWDQGGSNA